MRSCYHKNYFFGHYFKCVCADGTVAVIPAYHVTDGVSGSSLQIITDGGAWNVSYPFEAYSVSKKPFSVALDDNRFSKNGFSLNIERQGLEVSGSVRFGEWSPIKYDIMGPYRFVPFMECRHSVLSMKHKVNGSLCINGDIYRFEDSDGYIEGDRGYSFPRVYAWTHCFFKRGSLMLSVADIPIGKLRFTGVIGVVMLDGKEYRIATYLGAKAVKIIGGEIIVRQKDLTFTARLIEKRAHPLFAPANGSMSRTIRESASCRAAYILEKNGETLISFESDSASFGYEFEE